ncbi:MAG TPA: AAA family ATPase, partial [Polyangia bacterium]
MASRMIRRKSLLAEIRSRLLHDPIVTILGPRQCGKTTVARWIAEENRAHFFDLEDPADRRALAEPKTVLAPLSGVVVIDEAQLRP